MLGTKKSTFLAALNFSGTQGSESSFYWHQETIYKGIRSITIGVIKEAMNEELKATILDTLYEKHESSDIAMDLC